MIAGDYKVEFVQPEGYEVSPANQGTDDAVDSDGLISDVVTLDPGEEDPTIDAWLIQPAGLGDKVFEDTNGNGIQDNGESGVEGVLVKLQNPDGTAVVDQNGEEITTTTDPSGEYSFTGLTPGEYKVMFVAPEGYSFTTANAGDDDELDSDADPSNGMTQTVTLESGEFNDTLDAGLIQNNPGIDIEKFTNGVDADTPDQAPEIAAGDPVTWTYEVTNTGNVPFAESEITVTDDQEGTITNIIDQGDGDNILAAGETWIYQKTGTAQDLSITTSNQDITFNLTGNSSTTGDYGNVRSFSQDGVSVDVSAFNNSSGNWTTAYLGAYGGGLGVTNRNEIGSHHRIDNGGSVDYVLLEFDQDVTVDRAFLDLVSGDSDISVWIGSRDGDISILNNSILSGFTKENNHGGSSARWANFNASELTGDTLVISARNNHINDAFKLKTLDISLPCENIGDYINIGTVQAGSVSDLDPSGYTNPKCLAKLGDKVWLDANGDGIQNDGETGVNGVTVTLLDGNGNPVLDDAGNPITTTTAFDPDTGINGYYFFEVAPGTYAVEFSNLPEGFELTKPDQGGNDQLDSDADPTTSKTDPVTVNSGEYNDTLDAGIVQVVKGACIGNYVFEDLNGDGIQNDGQTGVNGVTVTLLDANGDPVLDDAGNPITTTTAVEPDTGLDGYYKFDVAPGTYAVKFSNLPEGFEFTNPDQGGNDELDSDADPTTGKTDPVTVNSGEYNDTLDAGIVELPDPAIAVEKFVRVDDNPISITKFVGVEPKDPPNEGLLLCTLPDGKKKKKKNKAESMVFQYNPSLIFDTLQLDDDGSNDKGGYDRDNNSLDDDNNIFVVVSDVDDATTVAQALNGDVYFSGNVLEGGTFTANAVGGKFDNDTYFYFFDEQSGGLLQSAYYHMSCSAPIRLGDGILSAKLIGYDGTASGLITLTPTEPVFVDANNAPGPETLIGSDMVFRYEVTNQGDTAISNIEVADNRLDNVTYVSGDENNDGELGIDETWVYEATETAIEGLVTNFGTVTGDINGINVFAYDAANYTGVEQPSGEYSDPYPDPFDPLSLLPQVDASFDVNNIGEDADSPSEAVVAALGDIVTFTYQVTNTGKLDLTINDLVDDNATPDDTSDDFTPEGIIVNGFNFGDGDQNDVFNPGETWYFQGKEVANHLGLNTNIVNVTATDGQIELTGSDPANYLITNPNIDIEKFVNGIDVTDINNLPEIAAGDDVTFTYEVTNTGNVAFTQSEVVVSDDNGTAGDDGDDFTPTLDTSTDIGSDGILSPGEIWTYFSATEPAQDLTTITQITHRIEAENFEHITKHDYASQNLSFASGGRVVKLTKKKGHIHVDFDGANGTYDIVVGYYDENDGKAEAELKIEKDSIGKWKFDQNLGGNGRPTANNFVTKTFKNITVKKGDKIELKGKKKGDKKKGGEDAIFDYVDFVQTTKTNGTYQNVATVTAGDVSDSDISGYMNDVVISPPNSLFCDEYGKPTAMKFSYTDTDHDGIAGGTDVITGQKSDKATAVGVQDDDLTGYFLVSDKSKPFDRGAKVYFAGEVNIGAEFIASLAFNGEDKFKSNTYLYLFDDAASYAAGHAPLQTMTYHTSCSQPIQYEDVIGGLTLVGYAGVDGGSFNI